MIKLIAALGNPGREYEKTRHNVAWLCLDSLPEIQSLNWKSKFKGLFGEVTFGIQKVIVLKPQTYMNLSGESIQPLMAFYKISPQELLVIHDELDLPFGQIQFKKGGGLAGHNGLKSTAELLGTDDFLRLRIGIGRPQFGSVSDYVLGQFGGDEQPRLQDLFTKIHGPLKECVLNGIAKVGQYNKKPLLT
jgi:PTH1 family peptidyl-tRNA hydrolase